MEYITPTFLNMCLSIFTLRLFESDVHKISSQLCQWLWPKLLRKLANEFIESRNAYRSRLDRTKPGPSGMSRNEAYSLPHKWEGGQYLLDVDVDIVREIKEFISNGEDLFRFPLVTTEFERCAEEVYQLLHIHELGLSNVWNIFRMMLPLLFPDA
jgi:hypothetical protein